MPTPVAGEAEVQSACEGQWYHDPRFKDLAYACWDDAPWSDTIDPKLAYANAAVQDANACGECFEIKFLGRGFYDEPITAGRDDTRDLGSRRIAGKRMIIKVSNTGIDVEPGQFDLMFPGGGVGIFDACSKQWDVDPDQLGDQWGGFLKACQRQTASTVACASSSDKHNYNNTACYMATRSCMSSICDELFLGAHRARLKQACIWFINWFEMADNPRVLYRKVGCPQNVFSRGS